MHTQEVIELWDTPEALEAAEGDEHIPTLTLYPVQGAKGMVVICPGGGYARRAEHERGPVAQWLNGLGISAAVLDYRVAPTRHPQPLRDAQRAIQYARHLASDWGHDPEKIGILGFSAGGHLAASAGTLFHDGDPTSADLIQRYSNRPNVMILGYPVISFGEYRHYGSMVNLLGESPSDELTELLSLEKQVTEHTPPAFIWFTDDDSIVPVENGFLLAGALRKHRIPFELHVFERGPHGLGLCDKPEYTARAWTQICETWLRKQGF